MEKEFKQALSILESCREFSALIPEVRSNLVYAREKAKTPADVLAVDGRITVVDGRPKASGQPKYGVSSHMARIILALGVRAGINFANDPELVEWLKKYCRKKGWVFSTIDRDKEPDEVKAQDSRSAPWKAQEAVRAANGKIPKIFYETAAVGKEPLSYLVGDDPFEVVTQICELARRRKSE